MKEKRNVIILTTFKSKIFIYFIISKIWITAPHQTLSSLLSEQKRKRFLFLNSSLWLMLFHTSLTYHDVPSITNMYGYSIQKEKTTKLMSYEKLWSKRTLCNPKQILSCSLFFFSFVWGGGVLITFLCLGFPSCTNNTYTKSRKLWNARFSNGSNHN